MAWQTIHHACGHEQRVQLYGPHRERDRKVAWMTGQPCPDCRRASASERDAANREDWRLPALTGVSESMIVAASSIRNEWIDRATAAIGTEAGRAECAADLDDLGEMAQMVRRWAAQHDRAGWWLDNRHLLVEPLALFVADLREARAAGKLRRRPPVIVADGAEVEYDGALPSGEPAMSAVVREDVADALLPREQPIHERAVAQALGDDPGPDWVRDDAGKNVRVIHRRIDDADATLVLLRAESSPMADGGTLYQIERGDLDSMGATFRGRLHGRYAIRDHSGEYLFFDGRKWTGESWTYSAPGAALEVFDR